MIDIALLNDKEALKKELGKKNYDVSKIDELEKIYSTIKKAKGNLDSLRAKRNEWAKNAEISVEDKRKLRDEILKLEQELSIFEKQYEEFMYDIPNLPDKLAPVGKNETENVVSFEGKEYYKCQVEKPLPHWEVGSKLNILDIDAASTMSGSMFALYKGKGAKLLRALVGYCLSLHENKYLEILPPHMVSSQTLTYTGHLPKFTEEQYKCSQDDLWLIPTAEVPLTALLANKTFKEEELPSKRAMAYTVAFRREAGSAGKDTRGLQRIHEFHKVELLKLATPETVQDELKDLLEDCLKIIKALKLRYRILDLCTGDMGDKYARCFDIEVFSPALNKWWEVASVGHFSDYQARRAGIKYLDKDGKKKIAYTLNGSGMATPRVIAAILETYQLPDGKLSVPEILRPFMGCDIIE